MTAGSGPISISWVPGPPPPRFAFAISKRVGTAVVRNRVRRRLKEGLRQAVELPVGLYLVRAAPAAANLGSSTLHRHLAQAARRLSGPARQEDGPGRQDSPAPGAKAGELTRHKAPPQ